MLVHSSIITPRPGKDIEVKKEKKHGRDAHATLVQNADPDPRFGYIKARLGVVKERTLALEKLRTLLQTFIKMVEMEEMDLNSMSGDTSVNDVTRNR